MWAPDSGRSRTTEAGPDDIGVPEVTTMARRSPVRVWAGAFAALVPLGLCAAQPAGTVPAPDAPRTERALGQEVEPFIRAYSEDLSALPRGSAPDAVASRRAAYERWLPIVLDRLGRMEESGGKQELRRIALSLANALERCDLSLELVEAGAAHALDWQERFQWHEQRASVFSAIAGPDEASQRTRERYAREAIEGIRPFFGDPFFRRPSDEARFLAGLILDVATIRVHALRTLGQRERAIEAIEDAIGIYETVAAPLGVTLWWPDDALAEIAQIMLEDGRVDDAVATLGRIDALPSKRMPMNFHAIVVADSVKRPEIQERFAQAWLDVHAWDAYSPSLALRLAQWLVTRVGPESQEQRWRRALALADTMLADHADLLAEADRRGRDNLIRTGFADPHDVLDYQSSPVTSEFLFVKLMSARALGLSDVARAAAEQFLERFPRHPSAGTAVHALKRP